MENTNNDWKSPVNEGEHLGADWARQQENSSVHYHMDKNDADEDEEEQEHELPEWGDIDPQDHPGPAGPMDPSGPGSAV